RDRLSAHARPRPALYLEIVASDAAIGFEIAPAGRIHDAGRQWRRRRFAVPAAGATLGVEIIAQRLLVEARLRLPRFVDVGGPEPRTVRGHDLVDQDDAPLRVAAEFELGVGDDDAVVAADLLTARVDRARHAFERIGHLRAHDLTHPADRDVFVVTALGFGGGREDCGLELAALEEAFRKLLAGERTGRRIFLPGRAREIAADHAFDRKHLGPFAQHGATEQ